MKKKIKIGLFSGLLIGTGWLFFEVGRSYRSFEIMMKYLEAKGQK